MNKNLTIFAVDDEPIVLELYESIFSKEKKLTLDFLQALDETEDDDENDLHTFTHGKAYLAALKSHYADGKRVPLSILDMRLPELHGLDIAKEARKIDPHMTIVIVTAYSDYTVKELIDELENRVYYVRKPFKTDELYALVHSNLREWNEIVQEKELQKDLSIDLTQDGLWNWNPKNNDIYFSPRWKEMLGYKDHELKNDFSEWLSRIHPDDKEQVEKDVQIHLSGKSEFYVNEHRLRCKDGSYKWILARGKALFNENNEAYKMSGFHTDITQRKKLEEQLFGLSESLSKKLNHEISKQAKLSNTNSELEKQLQEEIQLRREKEDMLLQQTRQAAMGEMISMIAHQWRQPLTVIGMIADNISLDVMFETLDTQKLQSSLKDISDQTKYLSQTIDDFRQFFVPNKEKDTIFLHDCVEGALNIIEQNLISHNIEVIKNYEDLTKIDLYKNELIQVFINFLKNAQDAFEEKHIKNAKIELTIKEYDTSVECSIEDNAGGIPLEIQKNIFDPYFTTKNKKNGTGLGLYMSKSIIEDHSSGTIKVSNTDDGVIFTLSFPKVSLQKDIM
jgi:PAS domain S-box-containing protein